MHVFVGFDQDGTACIFVGRLDENGDFKGDYLSEAELQVIASDLAKRLAEDEN